MPIFSQLKIYSKGIMCRSLIPNFTKLQQQIWKIRAEINLRPGVKFRFHCADFNKNHSRSINLVEILYTELHSNRSRNMEVQVEIHLPF